MTSIPTFTPLDLDALAAAAKNPSAYGPSRNETLALIAAARERDALAEEVSIWKSVFPDIAPSEVQPDRSRVESDFRARIAELERQNGDLQAANNDYLDRARKAKTERDSVAIDWGVWNEENSRLSSQLATVTAQRDRAVEALDEIYGMALHGGIEVIADAATTALTEIREAGK